MRATFVMRSAALAAGLAALALAPSRTHAQVSDGLRRPFVGLGVGVENVRETGQHRVGLTLHARAGRGFGSNAVMLEGAWHGIGDDQARTSDVAWVGGEPTLARRPRILKTMSLLAAVQFGLPGDLYVRPAAGVGWQSFALYRLGDDSTVPPIVEMRKEMGPAAQLAFGRTLRLSRRVPVAVEAIGLWSDGEDTTGTRWAAGVQVVPMLRF